MPLLAAIWGVGCTVDIPVGSIAETVKGDVRNDVRLSVR
jgi:hypothetical protein